jgi:hypothetical protein
VNNSDAQRNLELYQESYSNLPFEPTQEFYRRKNLISWLQDKANLGAVMEVGSGRNSIFKYLEFFESGTVVEPIKEFLRLAENDLVNRNHMGFFWGRLDEFVDSPSSKTFDTVIVSSLFHEVSNTQDFLSDLKSVIHDDSTIFFIVSNRYSVHRILGVQLGFQQSLEEKTETQIELQQFSGSFSSDELRAVLVTNGFEILRLKSFFIKPLPHKVMQDLLELGTINQDFLDTLDKISENLPGLGSELIVEVRLVK